MGGGHWIERKAAVRVRSGSRGSRSTRTLSPRSLSQHRNYHHSSYIIALNWHSIGTTHAFFLLKQRGLLLRIHDAVCC